jgi:hypothetical protein
MARYGAGASRAGINTANSAYFNLNGSTSERLLVRQVIVNIVSAPTNAPAFYLARATARGTQSTTLAGQPLDAADAAAFGALDSAWSVNPTFSTTNLIATGGLAVTAGGAFIWTFYDVPLVIPATAGAGLVLANSVAVGTVTGTFAASFIWDE